jgi:NitT/TauT family transport system ATP-binding protein
VRSRAEAFIIQIVTGKSIPSPGTRARRPLIAVTNVTKTFATRDGGELPVLEGITLSVQPGEIVALLGKSGSGKSTLLRCIAGLVQPSSGSISYRGKPLTGINPGVSLVFQTFALLPWLTVQQNVELGLEAQGVEPEERARHALEAIDLIGLDGFESAFPKELSGGMRQRVGFARALVVEPDLLLMDEPFSALDVLTAENLRTELLELWSGGNFPAEAILIVTHNIEEAVMFADRVIVLGTNPGRIRSELTARLERPRDRHDPEFDALVDEIYGIMTDRPSPAVLEETTGQEGVQQVMLPHASVDGIAGLAELVLVAKEESDLGDLATVVGFEIDDLFPIVDALTILGFATVDEGRLRLSETGERFAGADIQESKQIFRQVALARVPLVRRIHRALRHSSDGTLREGFFLDLLQNYYSPEEARAQLDTAIDWARYAELFEYDAGRGEIRLHEGAEEQVAG